MNIDRHSRQPPPTDDRTLVVASRPPHLVRDTQTMHSLHGLQPMTILQVCCVTSTALTRRIASPAHRRPTGRSGAAQSWRYGHSRPGWVNHLPLQLLQDVEREASVDKFHRDTRGQADRQIV